MAGVAATDGISDAEQSRRTTDYKGGGGVLWGRGGGGPGGGVIVLFVEGVVLHQLILVLNSRDVS